MTKSSNEKGYTMLEVIMYTGLIIILTGTIANLVSNVFYRYKIGRINQQVIDLKKTISYYTATWENYGEYDDEANTQIDRKRILSLARMQEDNALSMDLKNGIHALAGSFDLGSAINYKDEGLAPIADNSEVNNKYMFYIQFSNLLPDACIEIITQGPFYSDSSDLDTLIVNNKYIWKYQYSHFKETNSIWEKETTLEYGEANVDPATNKKIIPSIFLSISDAQEACSREKNNLITWIFS